MNRQQAEHILDAYAIMCVNKADADVLDALRAVIIDAMTEQWLWRYTYPITVPSMSKPSVPANKPVITYGVDV